MLPASARICRTISISASSANAPAITLTTNMPSPFGRRSPVRSICCSDGPAASSLFVTGGFAQVDENAAAPDIQFHLGFGSGIEAGIAKLENAGVTLNSAFMRPRSRGTVRLASADPQAAPLIDPNYWSDPHDREMSLRGFRLAREIMAKPALKAFVLAERVPGPEVKSDDELAAYACASAKTDHHPAGTCRMGMDAQAVVNPDLTFRGSRACASSMLRSCLM